MKPNPPTIVISDDELPTNTKKNGGATPKFSDDEDEKIDDLHARMEHTLA